MREPTGSFGWLEDRLLHDGWLAQLGVEGVGVMALLALAADRRGASFYGRARMAERLGLSRGQVDQGLARLLAFELVAFRPWREGSTDGVWQLLPVPAHVTEQTPVPRTDVGAVTSIGAEIARLGITRTPKP